MQINLLKYIAVLFLLSYFSFSTDKVFAGCTNGFSSSWELDYKTAEFSIKSVVPMSICNYIENQLHANFKIKFLKGNKAIFVTRIYWADFEVHELSINGDKLKRVDSKMTSFGKDYKIIKVPISLQSVDRYEIVRISDLTVLARGVISDSIHSD
jgi:hypothetical protein